MGKKLIQHAQSEQEQDLESEGDEQEIYDDEVDNESGEEEMEDEQEDGPTPDQIRAKFAYKGINKTDELLECLDEVKKSFYNRLESARLIKKQGHVPFTEHMSITHKEAVSVPEALQVKDTIKKEIAFYNTARDNVMQGMRFLIQSRVPIARPDDFLAEMLKTDQHMIDIKQRLLKQQTKIKTFEENKTKVENKKLHKSLKDFKMRAKHSEKRENMKNIEKLKKKIQQKGGDQLADSEFDNIMSSKKHESQNRQGRKSQKGHGVLQQVKDKKTAANAKKQMGGKKGGFKGGKAQGGSKGGKSKQNKGSGYGGKGGKSNKR